MAGDWIKLEHATPDKPEVGRIAEILSIDHDAAFGKVVRFWIWADQQAADGNDISVTRATIDRITHCPGFSDALLEVDWLQARSGSFAIPHFARHNGHSAKQRAETNRRVTEHRKKKAAGNCNGDLLQKPLPEKRREEKSTKPHKPLSGHGETGGLPGIIEDPPDGLKASRDAETRDRCLPEKWRNIPAGERKRVSVLRNSPMMERIGKWFNRRPTTLWSLAEGVALFQIKPDPEDVEILEEYYLAVIDEARDHRRKSLETLLNNWRMEVDRANNWKAAEQ